MDGQSGGNVQLSRLCCEVEDEKRRVERNMVELRHAPPSQRKADLDRVAEEYDLIAQLAVSNGE